MSGPPINQVYRGGETSYRYMKYPLQQQPLQLLYPGRYMTSDMHFTRDNVKNEDPEGLARTKFQDKALQQASDIESEALSRHLGGHGKVLRHPSVMPEASIEDPTLANVTINDIPNPNLRHEPNQFSIANAGRAVNELVRDAIDAGASVNLPLVQEKFKTGSRINRDYRPSKQQGKDILDSFTDSDGPGIIFFVLIAVIALMIIGLIIYGLYMKSKGDEPGPSPQHSVPIY